MDDNLLLILIIILGLYLSLLVINQPYLGVAITIASLPILDLLPNIPYFSSVVSLIGAITIAGFLLQRVKRRWKLGKIHLLSILFIAWMVISHPQAALFGSERNWVFTFIQLWILLFLAGNLLDTHKKQQVLMSIFAIAAIVSAFFAISTGSIGENYSSSLRSAGLTDNANAAARYFVVAMVFITYLRLTFKNSFLRFIALTGIIATYLGVFFTVSRTGIILLFTAQIFIVLMQSKGKERSRFIIIYASAFLILWFLSDSIIGIVQSIFPTIIEGTGTFGLRLNLWRSGLMMWLDHPITGVGIGMYINMVGPYMYSLDGPRVWNAVAHSTYIQVLAETGIVGFVLFVSMIINSINNFWKADVGDKEENKSIRNVWLIVFLVLLIGGITKSDHADKLTWMIMGMSTYFQQMKFSRVTEISKITDFSQNRSFT